MIKVYHNPRCAKSREAIQWLQEKNYEFQEYRYMDEGLRPDEMEELLEKLDMDAQDLIRKNEKVWKENYSKLDLSEEELIMVMVEEPRLMQRPIVVQGDLAILARPVEELERLAK